MALSIKARCQSHYNAKVKNCLNAFNATNKPYVYYVAAGLSHYIHKYVNMYKPGSVHVLDVIIHKPANS